MKVLVTGAAGYLGSVAVPILLQAGHEIIALDNFMYNQNSLLDCCYSKSLTILRADACDDHLISNLVKKVDAILPLACLTGAPLCDQKPKEAEEVIIGGLRIILKNRSKDQMIIYPTTNSGYGIGEKGKFCTEETPLRPISVYGKLKVQAEKEILEAGNGITLRLATAFGVSPRMRLDLLVNDFVFRAVHMKHIEIFEGHFNRNFVHVRDIANAFLHSLQNFEKMKNTCYNVGLSDANLNKIQLCQEIKKHLPDFNFVESKNGTDPDKRDYIVSNEKIEKTGFRTQVSLSDGIKELIRGYQVVNKKKIENLSFSNV